MRLSLLTILFSLLCQSTAVYASFCHPTERVYRHEKDSKGIELALVSSCVNSTNHDDLCIYSNGKHASISGSIHGQWIDSSDLYQQSVSSNKHFLQINLKSVAFTNDIEVSASLDKKAHTATVIYKNNRFDIRKGIASHPNLGSIFNCR